MARGYSFLAKPCPPGFTPSRFIVHSFLSVGRLHLPVFGLFAAAGLMAAMVLSQRTARWARVDAGALWDAGMGAVFSAFLLSRALLVAENFRTSLTHPLLVLELPSLTAAGVILTAIATAVYLRRRRLPLLRVLDAAAPCAALLSVFLEMGRMADGRREGMPTTARWAIASRFGQVHPVEIYSTIAWLALCAALLGLLRLARRAGGTGAWGLLLGGLLLFVTDFFRLPSELYGTSWFDRVQWFALILVTSGGLMLAFGPAARGRAGRRSGNAAALAGKDIGDAL